MISSSAEMINDDKNTINNTLQGFGKISAIL